jgi:hypothetical protein
MIYSSNTQAAPLTWLYRKDIALILKSMKNAQQHIIAFHIQTNVEEHITISSTAAYTLDPLNEIILISLQTKNSDIPV